MIPIASKKKMQFVAVEFEVPATTERSTLVQSIEQGLSDLGATLTQVTLYTDR